MIRVVVTGIGAVTPVGHDSDSSFSALAEGQSGVDKISLFDPSLYKTKISAEVKNLDLTGILERKEAKKSNRSIHFIAKAAHEAWTQANLNLSEEQRERAGTVIGSGMQATETIAPNVAAYQKNPRYVSPYMIPYGVPNSFACFVAKKYGLNGSNFTVSSACASGTIAIGEAFEKIKSGSHDIMLCGGVESPISPLGISGFNAIRALSEENESPQEASRPFCSNRSGFIMGEGSGILVLESLESAEKRGAEILAEIVGYGNYCEAKHLVAPDISGAGISKCMNQALRNAKLNKDQIDYINAHGTSTKMNDVAETKGLKSTFGDHAKKLRISSIKGSIGHGIGAAGGIEAVVTIKSLMSGIIPPTINLTTPDPECDLDYTANHAVEQAIEYAISNSFAFGGINGSIILKKWSS